MFVLDNRLLYLEQSICWTLARKTIITTINIRHGKSKGCLLDRAARTPLGMQGADSFIVHSSTLECPRDTPRHPSQEMMRLSVRAHPTNTALDDALARSNKRCVIQAETTGIPTWLAVTNSPGHALLPRRGHAELCASTRHGQD